MAELKILGVKRVEALLAVLEQKEKEAVASLVIPSTDDIEAIVDEEFGLTELRTKEAELKTALEGVLGVLNDAIGEERYVSISENYRARRGKSAYKTRYDELVGQLRNAPINDVKEAFKLKRTQLWMCETLEEAKAIVGI